MGSGGALGLPATWHWFCVLVIRQRSAIIRCVTAGRASEPWCHRQSVGVRAGVVCALLTGTRMACTILDVFVPLVCPRLCFRIQVLHNIQSTSRPDG